MNLVFFLCDIVCSKLLKRWIPLKKSEHVVSALKYIIWSVGIYISEISWLIHGNFKFYSFVGRFLPIFISSSYMYEIIYGGLDAQHIFHHSVTLGLHYVYGQHYDEFTFQHIQESGSAYLAYPSSALSHARIVVKYNFPQYYTKVNTYYKYSYIVLKPISILFHWYRCYHLYTSGKKIFIEFELLYCVIHLLQLYFMTVVYTSLVSNEKKIKV